MEDDPTKPVVNIPPRTLYEWTSVHGHQVTDVERGRARCVCGEVQPVHELMRRPRVGAAVRQMLSAEERGVVLRAARDWRAEHLTHAWPLLVAAEPEEPLEDLTRRVEAALEVARSDRERLATETLVAAGQAIPVATEEEMEAGVRAAVLKHQHQQLCSRLRDAPWLRDDEGKSGERGTIFWAVAAHGNPLDEL